MTFVTLIYRPSNHFFTNSPNMTGAEACWACKSSVEICSIIKMTFRTTEAMSLALAYNLHSQITPSSTALSLRTEYPVYRKLFRRKPNFDLSAGKMSDDGCYFKACLRGGGGGGGEFLQQIF